MFHVFLLRGPAGGHTLQGDTIPHGPKRAYAMIRAAGFTTAVTTRKNVLHQADCHGLTSLPRVPVNGRFQQPAMIDALVSGLPMVLNQINDSKDQASRRQYMRRKHAWQRQ